jgi:hypothetical protein
MSPSSTGRSLRTFCAAAFCLATLEESAVRPVVPSVHRPEVAPSLEQVYDLGQPGGTNTWGESMMHIYRERLPLQTAETSSFAPRR